MRRGIALTAVAVLLGAGAIGVGATDAAAAQYNFDYGTDGTGGPVPVGTAYSMHASSLSFTSTSSPYGAVFSCGSATLGGATDVIVSGGPSAGLTMTSGALSDCEINGSGVTIDFTENFSRPWQLTPTGGTTSPFTGTISNASITLACGSGNAATFTGTLSTGLGINDAAPATSFTLTHASSLTKSSSTGTGCALPTNVDITATFKLTSVGGVAIKSNGTNNLWLQYS